MYKDHQTERLFANPLPSENRIVYLMKRDTWIKERRQTLEKYLYSQVIILVEKVQSWVTYLTDSKLHKGPEMFDKHLM